MNKEEMSKVMNAVMDLFHENDRGLLSINDTDTKLHEVAISHRIAFYVEIVLGEFLVQNGLKVDIEYNKHGEDEKRRLDGSKFRPDIVVHIRGADKLNLLVIEVKKEEHSKADKEEARKRVDELCLPRAGANTYGYEFGFVLEACNTELKIYHSSLDKKIEGTK